MVQTETRLVLKIMQYTVFKRRIAPPAQLAFNERVETSPLLVNLKSYTNAVAGTDMQGHLYVELAEPCHGATEWYVDGQYCAVEQQAVQPQAAPSQAPHPATPTASASHAAAEQPGKMNQKGIELLKHFEGFRSEAYKCPAGIWTIGYGFTAGVKPGDRITEAEAEERLREELARFEKAVSDTIKVKLTSNQFSALVSFTFNLGAGALKSSTLARVLNQGDYQTAANEFLKWNKAGKKVLPGLTKRREAERELFLS